MALPATLLLTRPMEASQRFARQLHERFENVSVMISPMMEISFLPLPDIIQPDAIIFTSRNGVAAWAQANQPNPDNCYCVGEATAEAARALGFDPFISGGNAAHLIDDLINIAPKGTLLHVRGRHVAADLIGSLSNAGLHAKDVISYEQRLIALSPDAQELLQGGERVIVPLFSPRSATHFANSGPFGPQVRKIAISKAVARACNGAQVAQTPDVEGMLSAISDILFA